jgi:hypothetical protein
MAMLKAKQIKLNAAGDILIGGTNGAGSVLSVGTDGTFLKVVSGALQYVSVAGTDVTFSGGGNIDAALVATNTEVDAIETAVGLNTDGTLVPFSGTTYLDAATSVASALVALDSAVGDLSNLSALHFAGTLAGTDTLPTTPTQGDVYRIITVGASNFNSLGFDVNIGDFIAYAGSSTWVKFDNTDPAVNGTTARISVSGDAFAGYTLDIDAAYVGQSSITTLGTITTGTWNGTTIAQANGGTGITTVTVAGDANKALVVGSTGVLEYAYISSLSDSAGAAAVTVVGTDTSAKLEATNATVGADSDLTLTTKGYVDDAIAAGGAEKKDDYFTVGATPDANYAVTLTSTPVGSVSVFFNGLKLNTAEFTVTGTSVALVDSALGYAAEEGDVISATYMA